MTSDTRAQRLVDEFEEGVKGKFQGAIVEFGEVAYSVRHGIAAVLRHIADTEDAYKIEEGLHAVSVNLLNDLAFRLTAPTLLERAMRGDVTAVKRFLHEAGFADEQGRWLPQYQASLDNTPF